MSVPTRIITGGDNRSVHPGDILEGAGAAEQVALGNAEALPEEAAAEEAPEPVAAAEAPAAEESPAPEAPAAPAEG